MSAKSILAIRRALKSRVIQSQTSVRRRITAGWRAATASTLLLVLIGCPEMHSPTASEKMDVCGPYPDWRSSEYLLPYPVGRSVEVIQGNCTRGGHQGQFRNSYDFDLALGELITAARSGQVVAVGDEFSDQTTELDEANHVAIRHADGTEAEYGHLQHGGALVALGDLVAAGDPVGLSGNSGYTGGIAHLHFHVRACATCDTIPVTFRNAGPNPVGLMAGQSYAAGAD